MRLSAGHVYSEHHRGHNGVKNLAEVAFENFIPFLLQENYFWKFSRLKVWTIVGIFRKCLIGEWKFKKVRLCTDFTPIVWAGPLARTPEIRRYVKQCTQKSRQLYDLGNLGISWNIKHHLNDEPHFAQRYCTLQGVYKIFLFKNLSTSKTFELVRFFENFDPPCFLQVVKRVFTEKTIERKV